MWVLPSGILTRRLVATQMDFNFLVMLSQVVLFITVGRMVSSFLIIKISSLFFGLLLIFVVRFWY